MMSIQPKNKRGSMPKFSEEEDQLLIKLVNELPENSWKQISTTLKTKTAKQCRDRWRNYANPILKHGDWSIEEEIIILQKYEEIGSKWSQMMEFLPNRSSNEIRYRWVRMTNNTEENNQLILAEKLSLQVLSQETSAMKNEPKFMEMNINPFAQEDRVLYPYQDQMLEFDDFDAFGHEDFLKIFGFSAC